VTQDRKIAKPSKRDYSLRMEPWYRFVRAAIGLVLRLLARVEIEGREHFPSHGPCLVTSNHLHWLDAPIIFVAMPVRSEVWAAEKWENRFFIGPLFRSLDAIFIRRGEVDRKAIGEAIRRLKAGAILGLAPEGTRSKTGGLQPGKTGVAYLAFRVGAPVLPGVCYGQEKVFSSLRRGRRARVRVIFGPVIPLPQLEGKPRPDDLRGFTEEIMLRTAAMLPPEYRGVYADALEKRPDLQDYHRSQDPKLSRRGNV
jgi:1-acyl-sn-glycerol-3-phosphate acyltransferase